MRHRVLDADKSLHARLQNAGEQRAPEKRKPQPEQGNGEVIARRWCANHKNPNEMLVNNQSTF